MSYAADAANAVVSSVGVTNKSFSVTGLSIANGSTYYLAWNYTGVGGSTNGIGSGIDNFSITAIPEPSTWALVGLGALVLIMRRKMQALQS